MFEVAKGLSLPLEFVTSTQVILAKKGAGKSYCASVQAEQLLAARQQILVVDPTGAWWGLRSSADGKSEGFPIAILGGDHGDIPLHEGAGEVIAAAAVDEGFNAVIDLSHFRRDDMLEFMADFLETLYRKNRQAMHLFVDEADVVAPQRGAGGAGRVLGAMEDIVRRGRIRGIGCTMITQRPAVLNKNVLTQADMLTCLRISHQLDLKAIGDWVSVQADPDQWAAMEASLPSLPIGTAWFWNPAADLIVKAQVNKRTTFDSGATPKAGARKISDRAVARVDVARLGDAITAALAPKVDESAILKSRISELEAELKTRPAKDKDVYEPVPPPSVGIFWRIYDSVVSNFVQPPLRWMFLPVKHVALWLYTDAPVAWLTPGGYSTNDRALLNEWECAEVALAGMMGQDKATKTISEAIDKGMKPSALLCLTLGWHNSERKSDGKANR